MNAVAAYAPGRVEILGNHTDYNLGLVLAAAIDRGLTVSGHGRGDPVAAIESSLLGARVEVPLAGLQPQADAPWANYALGVVHELREAGFPIGGFEARVSGDLPAGAGLSSSAALEVGTALFLQKLFALNIAPMAMAKLCQRAEAHFVGVRSGLLDQVTCLFGRANHLVHLDCRNEHVRTVNFPADAALVIADPGIKHALVAGEYNARREECAAAARALGLESLREIGPADLQLMGERLDGVQRRRAAHIVGENVRVARALGYIADGNLAAFGELMNASHESSRHNFENSTPALDLMVELARALPGVLGSRLTGGGFGGATVTLVRASRAPAVAQELAAQYAARSGRNAHVFACRIADGAH